MAKMRNRVHPAQEHSAISTPQGAPHAPRWRDALRPGLHLKRWFVLFGVGVALAALGFALLMLTLPFSLARPVQALALPVLPVWASIVLYMLLGALCIGWATWRIVLRVAQALAPAAHTDSRALMEALLREEKRTGVRVVAIGGGTGMPQLLRGLRAYTDHITAIVTVADDGGSSGMLRQEMGMLPPGDFRNNIAALSESENLMTRLFQYRFADLSPLNNGSSARSSTPTGGGLAGHSFGNLFIATMAAVAGSFEAGIAESSRVLAVRGRILPSTLENVTLCAEVSRPRATNGDGKHDSETGADGDNEWLVVEGESNLAEAGGRILRVFLKPEAPRAYPEAIRALLQADLIVASPGSFYTSLLPNLLVPALRDAIEASSAQRIYISNVATERGETDQFGVIEHLHALRNHAGNAFNVVLANHQYDTERPIAKGVQWVTLPAEIRAQGAEGAESDKPQTLAGFRVFTGDLVEDATPWRHDSQKLARRLMQVHQQLEAEKAARQQAESAAPLPFLPDDKDAQRAREGTKVPLLIRKRM